MSAAPTTVSLMLEGLDILNYNVNGSIVGTSGDLTTYSLACGERATTASDSTGKSTKTHLANEYYEPPAVCFIPTSFHITEGPSTVFWSATRLVTYMSTPVTETQILNCTFANTKDATCSTMISSPVEPMDGDFEGPITLSPVTITGSAPMPSMTSTPGIASSGSSNGSHPTSQVSTSSLKAGAPVSGINELAGVGSLVAVVAVLMGLL